MIALLHRLGREHRRPQSVARKLDPTKQAAFSASYDDLMNHLGDDEVVLFGDAVHPTHEARPVGCWAPRDTKIAVEQTSGRQNLNIQGAIDLETGQTAMLEALDVDAQSTIRLLIAIQAMYPRKRRIHLFLDNARYHHARLVREWLAPPGCRIKLPFVPTYCPHLNPIERLWGPMHRNITRNRTHKTIKDFAKSSWTSYPQKCPKKWTTFCDQVADHFRVIDPADFRVIN